MSEAGLLAYSDMLQVLDRALESTKGLTIRFENHSRAMSFRFRLYSARTADRKQNRLLYEPNNPLWGQSPYDELVMTIHNRDGWTLFITKGGLGPNLGIEEIIDIATGEKLNMGEEK